MKLFQHYRNSLLASLLVALASACADNLAAPVANRELSVIPENAQPSADTAQAEELPESTGKPAQRTSGLTVHIDPVTGQILPSPPAAQADQKLAPRRLQPVPAPAAQLVEEPSPTPGGGVKVNLNRRFHIPLVAITGKDGKVTFRHRPSRQAGSETE